METRRYHTLNGNSGEQIKQDFVAVVKALQEAKKAISLAESLYHGRNSISREHAQAMYDRRTENCRQLTEMIEKYMDDFHSLGQSFNL